MTQKTPAMKNYSLMTTKRNRESLQKICDEMKRVDVVSVTPAENAEWVKQYRKWTSTLRRTYRDALQKGDLDEVYAFNRSMGPVIQRMNQSTNDQAYSWLYAMGMFCGTFVAMSDMLPQRNNEQIFNLQMAELRERVYIKQIIKVLYEGGCVQHKQMCGKINISASQLTRSMSELIAVGCVKRYRNGKASVYMLTAMGEKYVKEFLGYKRLDYLEYTHTMLAGKKPQMEQRGKYALRNSGNQAEAYHLSTRDKVRRNKRLWADEIEERGMEYE